MQVIMTMGEYERLKKSYEEIKNEIFWLLKSWVEDAKVLDEERGEFIFCYDDLMQQLDEWLRDEWK